MSGDILDQIDDVLTDWHGSDDSMRWSPYPPAANEGLIGFQIFDHSADTLMEFDATTGWVDIAGRPAPYRMGWALRAGRRRAPTTPSLSRFRRLPFTTGGLVGAENEPDA